MDRPVKEHKRTLLTQLVHNGIVIPEPPPYRGYVIRVRGRPVQLTPLQEEMALAWAKKQGTSYVSDPAFVANFLGDFGAALGTSDPLTLEEVDFTSVVRVVEAEREAKALLTREERKAQAAIRKAIREELKETFGHATVNGERAELGAYIAEPSGIFMGRGEHPLRGRWKQGASHADVTLNLSPDAPRPQGDWGEIVWQPESLWVARWQDKLSDKLKYVWLSDTAPVKQEREAQKFDKAIALHGALPAVRQRIQEGLRDSDPRRRMIAMACYLIDALCLRVGDEKAADEADTVGATTLRPEHVTIRPDGVAEFDFLGKDSVPWYKELELPPLVRETLEELIRTARPSSSAGNGDGFHPTRDLPQLFPDIHSRNINTFLSRIHEGLSAKVFRTYHATQAVTTSLVSSGVTAGDSEYRKWQAAVMANLEAAILCNHTKAATGSWEKSEQRFLERLEKAEARLDSARAQVREREEALKVLQVQATIKEQATQTEASREKTRARYERRIVRAKGTIVTAKERVQRTRDAVGKIKAQREVSAHKRTWNLNTSLKSYIDPRVYYRWGRRVDYDVIEKHYPKALRRKFAWVRAEEEPSAESSGLAVSPARGRPVHAQRHVEDVPERVS